MMRKFGSMRGFRRALSLLLSVMMAITLAVPACAAGMTLTIRFEDSSADLTVEAEQTVGALKEQIAESEALGKPAVESQTLTTEDGTELSDNEATLDSCGLADGDTLILTTAEPDDPDKGGDDDPDKGGDDDPDKAGNDDPDKGGNDDPDKAGNDDPDKGGSDDPDKGGNDDPDKGGNDDPDKAGNDDPDKAGNDDPDKGGDETAKRGLTGTRGGPLGAAAHSHDNLTYTAWTSTYALPNTAGNYYLTDNVTLSGTWYVPSGVVNLCLNGKTISLSSGKKEPVITISGSMTLNLYDCAGGGKITGGNAAVTANNHGGGVFIRYGTFNMYGGTISGNKGQDHGGGVAVGINNSSYSKSAYFNMYGGTISGNTSNWGGGVSIYGTARIYGGTISGNAADSGGGGIELESGGKLYVSGGTITGNRVNAMNGGMWKGAGVHVPSGSQFHISGSPNITNNYQGRSGTEPNNVFLRSGLTMTVDGPLSGTPIGVSTQATPTKTSPVVITSGLPGNGTISNFTSDRTAYVVGLTSKNEAQLMIPSTDPHVHSWTYSVSGNTITASCSGTGSCTVGSQTLTLSAGSKTYDGSPVTASTTKSSGWSSANGLADPGTISYTGNTAAGTYTASVTAGGKTASASFTIAKKSVTVKASNQSVSVGDTVTGDPAKATLSGAVSGDSLTAVTLSASSAGMTSSGVITPSAAVIRNAAGDEVTANYAITYTTGTLSVSGPVYRVLQNADGSWTAPASPLTSCAGSYTVPSVSQYAASGYSLNSFRADSSGRSAIYEGATINANGASALYVYYSRQYATLSFYKDSAGSELWKTESARIGGSLSAYASEALPAVEGYTFAAWSTDPGQSSYADKTGTVTATNVVDLASSTMPEGGLTLYPILVRDRLNIKLVPGGDASTPVTMGTGTDGNPQSTDFNVDIGEIIQMAGLNSTTRVGYTLDGWYTQGGVKWPAQKAMQPEYCDKNPDGTPYIQTNTARKFNYYTVTLTARWTPVVVTVNYDAGQYGSCAQSSSTTALGSSFKLPEVTVANPAKTFTGWLDKKNTLHAPGEDFVFNDWTLTENGTLTLTAQYMDTPEFAIIFDSNGGTAVAPITNLVGQTVQKPADPSRTGYTFAGWTLADGSTPFSFPYTATTNETIQLKAAWTINSYTITFNSNGGSAIDPITENYGTPLSVSDPVRTGYSFAGWEPALPASMPAENLTLGATWTINSYTITFDSNGGSEVAPITQEFGSAVTAPADPTREGFTFAGWYEGSTQKDVPSFMPAGDMTLTAHWKENQTAPAAPEGTPATTTISVTDPKADQEYSIDGGATWRTPSGGELIFEGLTPGTSYPLITRMAETASYTCSEPSPATSITTLKETQTPPDAPDAEATSPTGIRIDPVVAGEEYAVVPKGTTPSDTDWVSPDGNGDVIVGNLTPGTAYDVYARKAETPTQSPSASSSPRTVTTPKYTPTVTAPSAEGPLTYNEAAQTLIGAGSADHGTLVYSLEENGSYSADLPSAVDAGEYTVYYKVVETDDTYGTAPASVTVRIEKADITPEVIVSGWTYGNEPNSPSFSGNPGYGGVRYVYSDAADGTYTEDIPETAGTFYVKAFIDETDNYKAGTSAPVSFTIASAAVTVTADDKSSKYLDPLQQLTYQIGGDYVTGDDLGITVSTTASSSADVGEYPITLSWNNNPNYTATLVSGKYTITKQGLTISASGCSAVYDGTAHGITVDVGSSDAVVYYSTAEALTEANYLTAGSPTAPTFTDAGTTTVYYFITSTNYAADTVSGSKTVEISPREIGLTWTGTALEYNGQPQKPAAAATGLIGTDVCEVTVSGEQTDAGSYTATASALSNPNYKLPAETSVAFTIAKNDDTDKTTLPEAQKATARALTYSGADQALVTAPEELPGGYSIRYSLDDGATWTEDIPTGKDAGSYTVKVKYVGDANQTDILGDDIPVTISGKPVTVTAADQTVVIKAEIDSTPDQAALTGALEGHVLTALTLTGSSTAEPTISGTITPAAATIKDADGRDVTANYEITYVTGKLTVKGDKSLDATVKPDDDVPVTKVEGVTEELAKKLMTEEETAMYEVGVPVHLFLELHRLDEKDVPAGDKAVAASEAKRLNGQLGAYLDLSLFKQFGSQAPEKIHDTKGNMITVVVEIPETLRNTNTAIVRTFYIVRIHDGKAEILAQGTGTTLTIKSDKFSTYLIAYKDTARTASGGTVPHTPQTGGTRHIGLWLCVLAVAGLGFGATTLYGKKRRTDK